MTAAQAAENCGDSETWPYTYEGYINQFQAEPTHKIHWQQQKHKA